MARHADWPFAAAILLLVGILVLSGIYVAQASRTPVTAKQEITIERDWLRKQQYRENVAKQAAAEANKWPATPPAADAND
ncbi:MAG TPA: hypothetical protein VF552_11410 [Allosphingosinicella sp.]